MSQFLFRYVVTGLILGAFDAFWLLAVASRLYRREMGDILLSRPNFVAAGIFYLIYTAGIVAFVVSPALEQQSWQHAVGYGALLGLVAYATYDLTNLATLRGFSISIAMIDLVWGVVLTSAVGGLSFAVIRWIS